MSRDMTCQKVKRRILIQSSSKHKRREKTREMSSADRLDFEISSGLYPD